jgi:hypothetical protein
MKRFASVFKIPFGTIEVSKEFQKEIPLDCLSMIGEDLLFSL